MTVVDSILSYGLPNHSLPVLPRRSCTIIVVLAIPNVNFGSVGGGSRGFETLDRSLVVCKEDMTVHGAGRVAPAISSISWLAHSPLNPFLESLPWHTSKPNCWVLLQSPHGAMRPLASTPTRVSVGFPFASVTRA